MFGFRSNPTTLTTEHRVAAAACEQYCESGYVWGGAPVAALCLYTQSGYLDVTDLLHSQKSPFPSHWWSHTPEQAAPSFWQAATASLAVLYVPLYLLIL